MQQNPLPLCMTEKQYISVRFPSFLPFFLILAGAKLRLVGGEEQREREREGAEERGRARSARRACFLPFFSPSLLPLSARSAHSSFVCSFLRARMKLRGNKSDNFALRAKMAFCLAFAPPPPSLLYYSRTSLSLPLLLLPPSLRNI